MYYESMVHNIEDIHSFYNLFGNNIKNQFSIINLNFKNYFNLKPQKKFSFKYYILNLLCNLIFHFNHRTNLNWYIEKLQFIFFLKIVFCLNNKVDYKNYQEVI
jgi:hypothetical protein